VKAPPVSAIFTLDPPPDEVEGALSLLRGLVTRYPLAVQAAVQALAAEGRAFAQTAGGRAWRERLCRSPHVARLRVLWEGVTEQGFSVESDAVIPSVALERLLNVAMADDLEAVLSGFFERQVKP
jgi:hypothetical protein